MKTRRLGREGPEVSALGLGCMAMSGTYGPADDAESVATIQEAIDCGITLLDTWLAQRNWRERAWVYSCHRHARQDAASAAELCTDVLFERLPPGTPQ